MIELAESPASALSGGESVEQDQSQQTRAVRLPFVAELRATEWNSGSEIWGETTNLSKGGCYARTSQPFAQDTLVLVEIRNHGVSFVTDARVAYSLEREGMGLSFLNVPADQLPVLEGWLSSTVGVPQVQASRRTTKQ